MATDDLFKHPDSGRVPFRFDAAVATVFPDMITRSVPGYAASIDGISLIAQRFLPKHGRCYDLGCSRGAALAAVSAGIGARAATLIGVDNSEAMLARCKADERFAALPQTVHWVQADIADVTLEPADLIILNYTLQFVPVTERDALIARLHAALRPGGALVLAEKFHFEPASAQARLTALHLDFKRAHHYSELEIAGKRAALENVLVTETRDAHRARLERAGFSDVVLWHAALNFGAFLAFRGAS